MIKVGFYQFCPTFGDVRANLHKIAEAIDDTKADILVLPELCTTGYLFTSRDEVAKLAEPIPGPTTLFLENVTRRKKSLRDGGAQREKAHVHGGQSDHRARRRDSRAGAAR
jgi:predicted amidohydrolase